MNRAVIDIGFGDSGKGCTTDWLCSQFPSSNVVRFSGGHQAGHHVVHEDIDHIFSSFGSGTLLGRPTYLESTVIIYPVAILNELKVLKEKGIHPILYINPNCRVATPFDVLSNRQNKDTLKHGSCGVGIFETFKRSNSYYSLVMSDLLNPTVLKIKLQNITQYYYKMGVTDVEPFMRICEEMLDMSCISIMNTNPFKDSIYEGSQGLLLDENIGFFPHVTPSSVGSSFFDDNYIKIDETYYVTRAYQTRHGNGPMTDHKLDGFTISDDYDKTNKFNEYQRDMRATMLDLDLLRYALRSDVYDKSVKKLVITCTEHLFKYAFHYNGQIKEYSGEGNFARAIASKLGFPIADVYICRNYKFKKVTDT